VRPVSLNVRLGKKQREARRVGFALDRRFKVAPPTAAESSLQAAKCRCPSGNSAGEGLIGWSRSVKGFSYDVGFSGLRRSERRGGKPGVTARKSRRPAGFHGLQQDIACLVQDVGDERLSGRCGGMGARKRERKWRNAWQRGKCDGRWTAIISTAGSTSHQWGVGPKALPRSTSL
jgi:hypothetical protein